MLKAVEDEPSTEDIRVPFPAEAKEDLIGLAYSTGMRLGPYVRKVLLEHLYGHHDKRIDRQRGGS